MKKLFAILFLGALAVFAVGCSGGSETTTSTATNTTTTSTSPASLPSDNDAPGAVPHGHDGSTATVNHAGGTASGDTPANVRAAFPDAQSITTQHKDISASQISIIEKDTNTKVAERDHHSYLAFSTTGGTRKQIGAATVVEANGNKMVVIYESRKGVPYIREVRAEGMPQSFLDQFKGKGHDDKFQLGGDLKANGVDDATARTVAAAIRQDAVIMQTLYGGKHSH